MAKAQDAAFIQARHTVRSNLDAVRLSLVRCVDEGMTDTNAELYNELVSLIDEIDVVADWNELEEMIMEAKTLEKDTAVWLSFHGRTSVSLPWPKRKA